MWLLSNLSEITIFLVHSIGEGKSVGDSGSGGESESVGENETNCENDLGSDKKQCFT